MEKLCQTREYANRTFCKMQNADKESNDVENAHEKKARISSRFRDFSVFISQRWKKCQYLLRMQKKNDDEITMFELNEIEGTKRHIYNERQIVGMPDWIGN